MSLITITIEDQPGGKVKTVFTPSVETLLQKMASGNELTSGEAYAIFVANRLREESKKQDPLAIMVPRLGRA